ncbi:hypothetical protein TNCV_4173261 [Trichonephila clavipes]|nr:hypothetical protein TNCV_4173261 [Trichonephila clavipes]
MLSVFISISGKEIARRIAVKIPPSCCLSLKWRIINLLDDIWMLLPEVESLGSWRKAAVGQVWLQSSNSIVLLFSILVFSLAMVSVLSTVPSRSSTLL